MFCGILLEKLEDEEEEEEERKNDSDDVEKEELEKESSLKGNINYVEVH